MNTRRTIDVTYRMARERRQEAITFFRNVEQNAELPFQVRNVAGAIARGLTAIYKAHFWTGDDKDALFKAFIKQAQARGVIPGA